MKKLILLPLIVMSCSNSSLINSLEDMSVDKGEIGDILFDNQANEINLINKLKQELAATSSSDEAKIAKLKQQIEQLQLNNLDQIIDNEIYDALKVLFNEDGNDEDLINELEKGVGNSLSKETLKKLANGTLTPPPATPYKIWDETTEVPKEPVPSRKYNNQTEYERVESKIADLKYQLKNTTSQKGKDNINKRIKELEDTKSRITPSSLSLEAKDELLLGDHLVKILSQEILDEVTKLEDEYGEDYLLGLDDLFGERNPKRRALVSNISKFKGLKNKLIAYSVFKYDNALKIVKAKRGR